MSLCENVKMYLELRIYNLGLSKGSDYLRLPKYKTIKKKLIFDGL